ncbi:MerR family transcriptional regulator [Pelagibacteraceae bacterium]|nr:MerR family transcriptional regulator [Pelagibacteraceae bacterium]
MTIKKDLFSISEVAKILGLINKKSNKPSNHTIRFWEKKFKQIRPLILNGNRRYYSKKQLDVLKLIYFLLKEQKLTLLGANKVLNNKINSLDDYNSSSIKAEYFKKKTKILLNKFIELRKKNGKKNTRKSKIST